MPTLISLLIVLEPLIISPADDVFKNPPRVPLLNPEANIVKTSSNRAGFTFAENKPVVQINMAGKASVFYLNVTDKQI